ncbi:phage tail protein I [Maridesulfovibrio frigidus]|uniref:phage tail protein I n=1 Tax=Maridesulfovibrio frigidus TaxID=340956 RepID=UPI00068FB2B8|nr:phage tail protein I [Maridesulfovibrio frigidus]
MSDLLPISATKQERDLSNAVARIEAVPVDIRDLWNPEKCPVVFLPWLAWSLSVDLWKDSWPEATKRAVIKTSIAIHRIKGTPVAVERYLDALGISADVLEWFEYDGDEYKFKVSTETTASEAVYFDMLEAVAVAKNTRSHLDSIVFHSTLINPSFTGGAVRSGSVQHIPVHINISSDPALFYSGAGVREADIITINLPATSLEVDPVGLFFGGAVQVIDTITIGGINA